MVEELLKTRLAERTGTQAGDWFLVAKARYGLEVVLQVVADIRGSGEVITQPFTCLTAVNPIISAGHKPIYADISPNTLSLDPTTMRVTNASRAVIVQHSFGIPADIPTVRHFASTHNLLLIEDSAHKPGLIASKNGQILADISVHSFGVEKMLPTKFGAAIWINPDLRDATLRDALRIAFKELPRLSLLRNLRLRTYSPANRALNHLPQFMNPPAVRDTLARLRLFEAAITPLERRGKNSGKPAYPSNWILQRIVAELSVYDTNLDGRQAATQAYLNAFGKRDDFTIPAGIVPDGVYTRFPIVCQTAEQASLLFARLAKQGLHPGKWYRPTLFPGPADQALYSYDPASCPIAEDISARILNLPTNVSTERIKEILYACHR